MKVVRARVCGYCMGVRRAIQLAQDASESEGDLRVYTLGPLIHNPQALASLKERGVDVLPEGAALESPGESIVVVRAHGVPPEQEQLLSAQGTRIIDATCPRVKASQNKARRFHREGYQLFLAGEEHHGEIVGILGYAPGAVVVGDGSEASRKARSLKERLGNVKTALIGQTTIAQDTFAAVAQAIAAVFPDLEVVDTICKATKDRQTALRELCGAVDAVVVVGGKESANTRNLFAIARDSGKPAWLVETAADLPAELASFAVVGLTAGASTPDEVISAVEASLAAL